MAGRVARFFAMNYLDVEQLPFPKVMHMAHVMDMIKAEEKLESLPMYDFPHTKQRARDQYVRKLERRSEQHKEKEVSSKEDFARFFGKLNG